jgi:hypothetical protein
VARCGNKEKMGLGGLGESLQAKKKRRLGATISTNDQQCIWGKTMVVLVKETTTPWVNLWKEKYTPGHLRPGQNPLWMNQGRLNHLEPTMVQQSMDSDTQLLGNEEWKNNQILEDAWQ